METRNMKIAFATDDGSIISPHFGRARYFEVITIVDGAVAARERRDKAGHATFSSGEDHHHEEHAHHSDGHGYDAASQHRHRSIVSSITDCHMVVSRGMGMGAFDHLTSAKIVPIITSNQSIDSAIREIIDGTIVHHGERLH